MAEKKYLYGAAVQGIQGFIFQTNELKDIVGASELVEEICTTAFDEFGGSKEDSILRAAGNIKHIFNNRENCEKAVKNFPKKVMEMAPGITISQAVVKMEGKYADFSAAVDELESRLRTQRNEPMRSLTLGLMGIQRSRKTGLPVYEKIDDEYFDRATFLKRFETDEKSGKKYRKRTTKKLCKESFGFEPYGSRLAYNIEDITKYNDWIAVIHADGNGLGQIVQKIGNDENQFKEFSQQLNDVTIAAANSAYVATMKKYGISEKEVIPIRPIVLGGDDFTAICRGDMALFYTKEFLKHFEIHSKLRLGELLGRNNVFGTGGVCKLTSCAGITFIKSSYPFYYGYDLAESLCDRAKKDAKKNLENGLAPSCLMFHKVQDSFVTDFDKIAARELTPVKGQISFEYGPYYLHEKKDRMTIDDLLEYPKELASDKGNALKSHLRQWMSILYDKSEEAAGQKLNRMKVVLPENEVRLLNELMQFRMKAGRNGDEKVIKTYSVYDVLSLCSVINQVTKKEEK